MAFLLSLLLTLYKIHVYKGVYTDQYPLIEFRNIVTKEEVIEIIARQIIEGVVRIQF